MPAWLMTWNPDLYPWHDFSQDLALLGRQGFIDFDWSCGQTRRIAPGETIWLLRLGSRPRGIFGKGRALAAPYQGPSWRDPHRTQMHVNIRWTQLLDAHDQRIVLPQQVLKSHPALGRVHWSPQGSGVSIPDEVNAELERVWQAFVSGQSE